MRSNWEALRSGLLHSLEDRASFESFHVMRSRFEALDGFESPAELLASISRSRDLDARDPALWALVSAARERRTRRLAQALLLLCFWPALDAIFHRRFSLFPRRPEDLASEIVARFTTEVQRVDIHRVRHLTATLLRNTERNILRVRRRERRAAARTTEVKPEHAVTPPPNPEEEPSPFGLPAGHAEHESIEALSAWLRRALGGDAEIVIEAIFRGKRRTQIAASLGISHAAARKRIERALVRVRALFLEGAESQPPEWVALAS
jgi:DNA-directed RNA polymerase specialized sigma24 family protein